MPGFSYVYILESESCSDRHYVGVTGDLNARILAQPEGHSSGIHEGEKSAFHRC